MRTLPLLFVALLIPNSAFAYLDAATGSMILQGLLAAIFGLGFTLKMYWHRVKMFFSGAKNESPAEVEANASADQPPPA